MIRIKTPVIMIAVSKAKNLFKSKWAYIIGAALVLVAAFFLYQQTSVPTEMRLENAAVSMIKICEDSPYRPSCYDKEIPKLMDEGFSMEEVFDVTRLIQERDLAYQYCHVLGHELSAKEVVKDPDKWKDVIARAPIGVCSNGAIHGAFQERFRVESFSGRAPEDIVPELTGICAAREDWAPTGMAEATCIHALGHLTMYVTDGHVEDSLTLCDMVVEENDSNTKRQLCYDGVFMQIYQPLEPEDELLITGQEVESKSELTAFCSNFTGQKYGSCVTEGWPLYLDVIDVPETAVDFCDRLNDGGWQYQRCLSGLFFRAMAGANLSNEWAESYCPKVREPHGGICFANAAARLIETDDRNVSKALALCTEASNTAYRDECFDKLLQFSAYNFSVGSERFYELCNGMPEKWKRACLNQVPQKELDGGT